jgi:hypothetical protein
MTKMIKLLLGQTIYSINLKIWPTFLFLKYKKKIDLDAYNIDYNIYMIY